MSSTIVKKENNEVTLKIEVDAEVFQKAVKNAYQKMKGRFTVPGFRKGKAPQKLIELHYGEGVFYDEAINQIFPIEYKKAIEEQNLEPVDRPNIDIEEIGKNKNFIFTATVTVKPEVKLGEYKGIEVQKKEYNVKEEDVQKEIEQLRERNARLVAVDREVKEGDVVVMDYKGFIGEEQFEGGTAESQTLEIGSNKFIPGFEEQLIGVKAEEEVEIKVTFPEEYHSKDLAGKEAVFQVVIHEIKEKELPELDDEFAKDVSEHDTLEALKEDIKKKQEEAANKKAEQEMKDELLKKVVDNTEIDIPKVMVEEQIENMLNEFDFQLQYQGLNLDTYLKFTNTKLEDMKQQMQDDAYNRVKTRLTLEAIAEEEKIEATSEEVDAEIEKYAKEYKTEVEKLKESLTEQNFEHIKQDINIRKTIEYLMDNAKIVA